MLTLSLLAVVTGHAANELTQLKRIDLDEVTRISFDPKTLTLEIDTVDTPKADGKIGNCQGVPHQRHQDHFHDPGHQGYYADD